MNAWESLNRIDLRSEMLLIYARVNFLHVYLHEYSEQKGAMIPYYSPKQYRKRIRNLSVTEQGKVFELVFRYRKLCEGFIKKNSLQIDVTSGRPNFYFVSQYLSP